MKKLIYILLLLPLISHSQVTVTGRILNEADYKPISNASVFFSKTTIGNKTSSDGTFKLTDVKSGKYEFTVSCIGFETYSQTIILNNNNINLPDILLIPQNNILKEVTIKAIKDPDAERNYNWFKDAFLGTSELAKDCKILNPEMLDINYDYVSNILTASSFDFLEIVNEALGYKIKYKLTAFQMEKKDDFFQKIHFEGSSLFEELPGTPTKHKFWDKQRLKVYEGSPLNFYRSIINDNIEKQGFWVLLHAKYPNPNRPSDSLISAKIKYYRNSTLPSDYITDSLKLWISNRKQPKIIDTLFPKLLSKKDIIKQSNQPGIYAMGVAKPYYSLYINYNKHHAIKITTDKNGNEKKDLNIHAIENLSSLQNSENTIITFNTPDVLFDENGGLINYNSVTYSGVWGRYRIAELLPLNYDPALPSFNQDKNKFNPELLNEKLVNIFSTENNSLINPQTDTSSSFKVIKALKGYTSSHLTEKAYLHLDKPYYATGDTLYFEAYVTQGAHNLPSSISSVLHVELINTENKVNQAINLKLDSGLAAGDMLLPDTLVAGKYRIRAYTRWMMNNNYYGIFEQELPITTLYKNSTNERLGKIEPLKTNGEVDLQFFPEGGSLVTGIQSKMGFKAIGSNGKSTNVVGKIINQDDKEITNFTTTHNGMGYFYLQPKQGERYKARYVCNNKYYETALPGAADMGICLRINNDAVAKASLYIAADSAYYQVNKGKKYLLTIFSGGTLTTVNCNLDSMLLKLDILKRKLTTGIAIVTLFSPLNEPLCERLLFVQNYNQLNLNLQANKNEYKQREKVSIKLNVKNRADSAVAGHFSVSVLAEDKVPFDDKQANTILTDLLLTSDLKGIVEDPNYYFSDTSINIQKNLDLLMLTQGYRRFEWKEILNNDNWPIAYQPEKGLEINGKVTNVLDKALNKGNINLIPSAGGAFLSTESDDKGLFHFKNLEYYDSTAFVLNAVKTNGKNATKIIYIPDNSPVINKVLGSTNTDFQTDSAMKAYIDNARNDRNEAYKYKYGRGNGTILKEVKITGKKPDDRYYTKSFAGAGNADQVIHMDDIEKVGGTLSTSLNGRLHGVTFTNHGVYNNIGDQMLIVIDGVELPFNPQLNNLGKYSPNTNIDFLATLNSSEVETVEVLKNANAAIYGMDGANGVLIITTKQGGGRNPKDIASIGVLPIKSIGYYKARAFYYPKYEINRPQNSQHDFRSTIYWNPDIKTDGDGNLVIEFYNADAVGTYKVEVQGIDGNGNLGRQVYRYTVE